MTFPSWRDPPSGPLLWEPFPGSSGRSITLSSYPPIYVAYVSIIYRQLFAHTSTPLLDCETSYLQPSTFLVYSEHTVSICQKEVLGPGFQVLFISLSIPCTCYHITLSHSLIHSFTQVAVIKQLFCTWALHGTQRQRWLGPSLALKQPCLVKGGARLSRMGNKRPHHWHQRLLMAVSPNVLSSKASYYPTNIHWAPTTMC